MADLTYSVNRRCSRCPRVTSTEVNLEELLKTKSDKAAVPAITVTFQGQKLVEFTTLCDTCLEIVSQSLERIKNRPKHVSSLRERGKGAKDA